MNKRLPKSKAGRVLVAVRDKMIEDILNEIRRTGVINGKDKKNEIIRKLNDRINKHFEREDLKKQTHINFKTKRTWLQRLRRLLERE